MRISLLMLLLPLTLGGCLSFSSSTPPKETVIVAPSGSAVCTTGTTTPC